MPVTALGPVIPGHALRQKLHDYKLIVDECAVIARNLRWRGPVRLAKLSSAYSCEFDAYSYVQHHSVLTTTSVGRYCSIAHYVETGMVNHHHERPITSSSVYFNNDFMDFSGYIEEFDPAGTESGAATGTVSMGHDVWMGAGVKIPSSVSIGHGAVIGTGTIVTRDVPPYAVVVGGHDEKGRGSQRIVRYRFSDEIISDLLELNWWNYDIPRMVASGVKVPRENVNDFISFLKNEDRESFIRIEEPWKLLVLASDSNGAIYNTEQGALMNFNAVELDDNGTIVRPLHIKQNTD